MCSKCHSGKRVALIRNPVISISYWMPDQARHDVAKVNGTAMIGFRNILVHNYLEVDRTIVHEVLQQDLGDLRNLEKVFGRFL